MITLDYLVILYYLHYPMKVLKIDSALAIIIVQKLVLFLFIFWVLKK